MSEIRRKQNTFIDFLKAFKKYVTKLHELTRMPSRGIHSQDTLFCRMQSSQLLITFATPSYSTSSKGNKLIQLESRFLRGYKICHWEWSFKGRNTNETKKAIFLRLSMNYFWWRLLDDGYVASTSKNVDINWYEQSSEEVFFRFIDNWITQASHYIHYILYFMNELLKFNLQENEMTCQYTTCFNNNYDTSNLYQQRKWAKWTLHLIEQSTDK